jgi:hypothetical protein
LVKRGVSAMHTLDAAEAAGTVLVAIGTVPLAAGMALVALKALIAAISRGVSGVPGTV